MPDPAPSNLDAFLDDAAVFPPGSSSLDAAVLNHLARRGTQVGRWTGPLLLPLEQVLEARRLAMIDAPLLGIDLESAPLSIGIIVPQGELDAALRTTEAVSDVLKVASVEVKARAESWLPDVMELRRADISGSKYVELSASMIAAGALGELEGSDVALKFRTGGLAPDLFPTPAVMAQMITAAIASGVPFKLTAGLHQATRHMNPATGFTHHGFLNIAVATAAAASGADDHTVQSVLEHEDPSWIRTHSVDLSGSEWRPWFRSFGTCSIAEPLDSLTVLGIDPLSWGTEAATEGSSATERPHL